jgi:two-component system response regulator HydG
VRGAFATDNEIRKFLESNGIIGKSKAIIQVGENIIRYGRTDLNVLITGQTGTGKKLVASAIHKVSRRMRASMITVDIPNITKEKFHTELFGYVRGAFDGANETTKGVFQQADKSSLFLDEIGALPIELQSHLLTPIEDKSIHKFGSIDNEIVDIRFIAATSTDLLTMIKDKTFNEQLYHRLRECEINIPPLASRKEDIPEIINSLTNKHNEDFQETKYFSSSSIDFLTEQNWNGNIRELYSVIKACLQTQINSKTDAIEVSNIVREFNSAEVNVEQSQYQTPFISLDKTLGEDVAEVNKIKIEKALIKTYGNVSKAAALLGVSRETLHNKIRKFGINHQQFRKRDK